MTPEEAEDIVHDLVDAAWLEGEMPHSRIREKSYDLRALQSRVVKLLICAAKGHGGCRTCANVESRAHCHECCHGSGCWYSEG
jgi:hypothetical protein